MKIYGLQKLTLLDYPSKTACTVFTAGCDFLCPFCHNASLVMDNDIVEAISVDDFLSFLDKRKGILDGVCITGGEPLIHSDIKDFIREIKDRGFLVKLDTNGSFPDRLIDIVNSGIIDYVAMDIKNSKENYSKASGIENVDISKIEKSVSFLMQNNIDFEFRTTAVKGIHTKDDFVSISDWIAGDEKYFIQNFKDSGDLVCQRKNDKKCFDGFENVEIEAFVNEVKKRVPFVKARGV